MENSALPWHQSHIGDQKFIRYRSGGSDGENFSEAKSKARKLIEHLESNPLTT